MSLEWSADCLQLADEKRLGALCDPAFIELRTRVIEYLKNSWCSEDKATLLLEVVVLTRPGVCVDVGAFTGSSTLPMLAGLQFVRHGRGYAVEAWSNDESILGLPAADVNRTWWASVDMTAVRTQFDDMLDAWSLRDWCEVLPIASADAVPRLPAIDFVHLDGNFSEEGAWQDSERFLPKVEPGGYILLSNALVSVAGKSTKMRALWSLFDRCDVVCEIDDSNTLLFKKR
jgi:predicted O-methyltransferase YrrM